MEPGRPAENSQGAARTCRVRTESETSAQLSDHITHHLMVEGVTGASPDSLDAAQQPFGFTTVGVVDTPMQ